MSFDRRYVLGVDALPLGNHAAVAVGRAIVDSFPIGEPGQAPLPLEERVRVAVALAVERHGAVPDQVHVLCIDDGGDGSDLDRVGAWLADKMGSRIQVLDLVATETDAGEDADSPPLASGQEQSQARARDAALW